MDLVYFYKINCDEGQVDKSDDEKFKKELKARKLIIYNELYSKMKNIYCEMKRDQNRTMRKYKRQMTNNKVKDKDNVKWTEDTVVKYCVDKELIMKIWKRFKIKGEELSSDDENRLIPDIDTHDKDFRIVGSKKFREIIGRRIKKEIIKCLSQTKNEKEYQEMDTISQLRADTERYNQSAEEELDIDEKDIEIADLFLSRFLITSDATGKGEIDLTHVLRALPKRMNGVNFPRIEMMNMSGVQLSIIAFQNDDKDELFNFYDKRNKNRMHRLRVSLEENNLAEVQIRLVQLMGRSISILGVHEEVKDNAYIYESYIDNRSETASNFD